jgi:hypothetical protein
MTMFGSSRSQEMRDLAGGALHPRGEHLVEIGRRRSVRHVRWLHLGMQQMVDLVMEDQRQAGDAHQQQEHRADEAGPFVDPGPFPQCAGSHRQILCESFPAHLLHAGFAPHKRNNLEMLKAARRWNVSNF